MFKLFLAAVLLAIVSAQQTMPTVAEMKASLIREGFSEGAAQGLAEITDKYRGQFEVAQGNSEAVKEATNRVKMDSEAYIATQSEADQVVYKVFIERQGLNV